MDNLEIHHLVFPGMVRQYEVDLALAGEDQPRLDPAYQYACAAKVRFVGAGIHGVPGSAAGKATQIFAEDPRQQAWRKRMRLCLTMRPHVLRPKKWRRLLPERADCHRDQRQYPDHRHWSDYMPAAEAFINLADALRASVPQPSTARPLTRTASAQSRARGSRNDTPRRPPNDDAVAPLLNALSGELRRGSDVFSEALEPARVQLRVDHGALDHRRRR